VAKLTPDFLDSHIPQGYQGRSPCLVSKDGGITINRALGNLLRESRGQVAVTLNTVYTYDTASRIASIAYPSGLAVAYARDAPGRITDVDAFMQAWKSAGFTPAGHIQDTRRPRLLQSEYHAGAHR
jgi:hypothetical protein